MSSDFPKIDAFKQHFNLKNDGEAIYIAIQKRLLPDVLRDILLRLGVTDDMDRNTIEDVLDEELKTGGVISEFAEIEAQEERKRLASDKRAAINRSLGIEDGEKDSTIDLVAERHRQSALQHLRSQIEEVRAFFHAPSKK